MKRLIYGGLLLAFTSVAVVGCKKEEIVRASSPVAATNDITMKGGTRYTTDNRMLIFATTEDYETTITAFMSEGEQAFIDNVLALDYQSYTEELAKTGDAAVDFVGDNFMSAILNKDMVVQIGDFLYKVNKKTDKVFVLPAVKISEYADLVSESKTNLNVRKFSTSDDVVELAESGASGEEKGLFCSDRKANEKSQTSSNVTIMVTPFVEMYIKASYNKFGVYFTIKAEGTHQTVSTSLYKFYFQVDNSSWAQRCGNSVSNYSHPWATKNSGTTSGGVQTEKYLFYNGLKQLKNYHFKVRFRGENFLQPTSTQTYTTYFTNYVMIEDY